MNFYTNVIQWGNQLFVRAIVNGQRQNFKVRYCPTLFSPVKQETGYKTLDGAPVLPIQFDNIKVALVVEEEHPFHIAFEIDGLDGEGKNWKYRRDNSISRYIEDPSGNKIELIWYMNQERK